VFASYPADPVAVKVLNKAVQMWGMGAANLVSLFDPQKIIFGGGVFGPAVQFIPEIYKEACKWGQPISMKSVKFCATEVQSDAALLGRRISGPWKGICINLNNIIFMKLGLIMGALLMTAVGASAQKAEAQVFIGKQNIEVKGGVLTPEALWAMGRIGGLDVSPDGSKIVYTVSYYSVKENKSHSVIYTMNADGSDNKMLTKSAKSESDCAWIDGGKRDCLFMFRKRKQQDLDNERGWL
jgi:hypothetical protein